MRDLLISPSCTPADLDCLASAAPPGCEGLVCLPWFSGEKAIVHDSQARGILAGLNLQHTPAHLARSALEGIAYGFREIVEAYMANGFSCTEFHLGGGGAYSPLWNQIKADVLGKPMRVLEVVQTGCMGAAILAAKAIGYFQDWRSAALEMVHFGQIYEPDPDTHSIYNSGYEVYQALYPACRSLFPKMASMQIS